MAQANQRSPPVFPEVFIVQGRAATGWQQAPLSALLRLGLFGG